MIPGDDEEEREENEGELDHRLAALAVATAVGRG